MIILNINTQLVNKAGTIPYRIHKQLLKQGYNSYFLTVDTSVKEPRIIKLKTAFAHNRIAISRFIRKEVFGNLFGIDKYYYYPQLNLHYASARKIISSVPAKPDIIIAYWIDFYFTQKVLYDLSIETGAPILWYMMDMSPLTGGCHMAYDCTRYEIGCGYCPALKHNWKHDISFRSYKIKREYIKKTNIATISASTYLYNQTNNCQLFKDKHNYKIMLPVEDDIFKPDDKKNAKNALGLPLDSKIIFLGAASLNVENKGMRYFREAINILYQRIKNDSDLKSKVLILIVGKVNDDLDISFPHKNIGYLNTQEKMAQAYQSADMFVCPTIQDSGPMMINEAIMCGTPVVSFEMGVAFDLVRTGETGYLSKLGNSEDLANGMESLLRLSDRDWNNMSIKCRSFGLECCAPKQQIDKVIFLAQDMIKNYK